MAEVALELELDAERRQPLYLRWYRAHASTARGLLSLLIVALLWEAAGRSGRWPLILAPLSDILSKFVQLAASGELRRHVGRRVLAGGHRRAVGHPAPEGRTAVGALASLRAQVA